MSRKSIRIGCGAGFWGDTAEGPRQIIEAGDVDYLVMDYLAEMTMSILARAKARAPELGYATDFVHDVMVPLGKEIERRKIKVVSNAGGLNPLACCEAIRRAFAEAGIKLTVAAVVGDDVLEVAEGLNDLTDMDTGAPKPEKLLTANAYVGAFPIAAALAAGADVVVVGRCTDSALVLGPLIHEFGWSATDWDRLAAGSLAGHVVECGPQVTGGIQTDWREAADSWDTIGFPIVECEEDGSFVVTKPDGTGGLVSLGSVAEQITYETGDPENYILPDVICDLSGVQLSELATNRIRVTNVRGKPATGSYKVSATYADGYRTLALLQIRGLEAVDKARATGAAVLRRTERIFAREGLAPYSETSLEILGAEQGYGPQARVSGNREVVLKIAARHPDRRALEILAREVAPPGTSMAPGTSGISGRPKVQPLVRLFSFLIDKSRLQLEVLLDGKRMPVAIRTEDGPRPETANPAVRSSRGAAGARAGDAGAADGETTVPLVRLAIARSGDKGDKSNIAVLARHARYVPAIRAQMTPDAVAAYMAHLVTGPVVRYEWPGLNGFNFLLHDALGGGGMASLRFDPQGKSHAQILLDFPISVPAAWQADLR